MATLTPSPPLGQSWLPPQCGHVFYQIRLTSGRDRVENDSCILWHGYNGLHLFGWSILTIRSQKVKIPWNRVCTAAGSHATTCSSLKRNTHKHTHTDFSSITEPRPLQAAPDYISQGSETTGSEVATLHWCITSTFSIGSIQLLYFIEEILGR